MVYYLHGLLPLNSSLSLFHLPHLVIPWELGISPGSRWVLTFPRSPALALPAQATPALLPGHPAGAASGSRLS